MTPMPIEDLGGLPAGDIRALVLENNEELNLLWDARMEKQAERFEHRMDAHERDVKQDFEKHKEEVRQRFDKQDALIAVVLRKVGETGELVREGNRRHMGWHKEDLTHRDKVRVQLNAQDAAIAAGNTTMVTVKSEVQDVRHRLKLISWLVMFARGIQTAVAGAEKGRKYLAAIAAFTSTLSALWLFFHSFIPWLKAALHH